YLAINKRGFSFLLPAFTVSRLHTILFSIAIHGCKRQFSTRKKLPHYARCLTCFINSERVITRRKRYLFKPFTFFYTIHHYVFSFRFIGKAAILLGKKGKGESEKGKEKE